MQRLAHGDIGLDDYLSHIRGQIAASPRALCLYASDAEIFDFRPGRYRTEEKILGSEWKRLAHAFHAVSVEPGATPGRAFGCAGAGGRNLCGPGAAA